MTRIDRTFGALRSDVRKAFVAYIMAGDPDPARAPEEDDELCIPAQKAGMWSRGQGPGQAPGLSAPARSSRIGQSGRPSPWQRVTRVSRVDFRA